MPWIQIVFYLITHAPQFIQAISAIIALIHNMPKEQGVAMKNQLEEAILYHKETGDESKLKKVCDGIGCPPGLVLQP